MAAIGGIHPELKMGKRVPELDVLRFLACLAVVFYHLADQTWARPVTQFGYLGVPLFFMISGFVIVWSADGRTAVEFGISRFARLYPCYWLCLAITLLAIWLVGHDLPGTGVVLANLTMAGGLLNIPYVSEVYWTLLVELKFYALIGFLLLARQAKYLERWIFIWLFIRAVAVFVELPHAVNSLTIAPFAPLFIAGALFYFAHANGWTLARAFGCILALSLAVPLSIKQSTGFLQTRSEFITPMILTGFFLLMALIASRRLRLQSSKWLISLAAITYPLYLLHNDIGKILRGPLGVPSAIAIVVLLSVFVDRIDRPIARWVRTSLTARRQQIVGYFERRG